LQNEGERTRGLEDQYLGNSRRGG